MSFLPQTSFAFGRFSGVRSLPLRRKSYSFKPIKAFISFFLRSVGFAIPQTFFVCLLQNTAGHCGRKPFQNARVQRYLTYRCRAARIRSHYPIHYTFRSAQ